MNQRTLGAFPGNNVGRIIFAAFQRGDFEIETKAVLLFFRTMTREAMRLEDWFYFFCEIDGVSRGWRQFARVDFRSRHQNRKQKSAGKKYKAKKSKTDGHCSRKLTKPFRSRHDEDEAARKILKMICLAAFRLVPARKAQTYFCRMNSRIPTVRWTVAAFRRGIGILERLPKEIFGYTGFSPSPWPHCHLVKR